MRARLLVLVLGLGLISTSCGTDVVGPGIPECLDAASSEIATATIIQLQAIPDATRGPCIKELKVGWEYQSQFAESGRTIFWLDSDRVGDEFLEVELAPACDPGRAVPDGVPEEGIERFVRVDEEPGQLPVAVIPVASRHVGDARALVTRVIGTNMKGRTLAPYVDESDGPAAARIESALRTVGIVLILDDAEVATDSVELRRFGHDPRVGISLDKALEEIEEDLGSPEYRAEWFHTFSGGCVIYRFHAKGLGSETIAADVRDAIGFYPLDELRDAARRAGFDV